MLLNKARLLTPGPTPLPEQVRLALAKDAVHHREHAFSDLLLKVEEQLKVLFGTSEPVLPLASSGTGAMTAAVDSLFAPGDKVIVINAGKFGERWSMIARARGLQVVELCYEWGLAANPEDIEACLEENRDARGLFVQLSETSTGVLHPVKDIAAKLKNTGVMLMNLSRLRSEWDPDRIFAFIRDRGQTLVLPDQDIIMALYGSRIRLLDTLRYNLSDRILRLNNISMDSRRMSLDDVRRQTCLIHYCGRSKPWKEHYMGRLGVFYYETKRQLDEHLDQLRG